MVGLKHGISKNHARHLPTRKQSIDVRDFLASICEVVDLFPAAEEWRDLFAISILISESRCSHGAVYRSRQFRKRSFRRVTYRCSELFRNDEAPGNIKSNAVNNFSGLREGKTKHLGNGASTKMVVWSIFSLWK